MASSARRGARPGGPNRIPARCWSWWLAAVFLAVSAAVWSQTVLSDTAMIHSGHSALWHNPERIGEGWKLEIMDDRRANAYWFTYDEFGNQRWLTAVGEIEGASIVFPEMLVTRGGRFGADFNPDDVVREVVGDMTLRFFGCDRGEVEYRMFGQSGTIAIERLTFTMATACPLRTGAPVKSHAAHSGSWFDPGRSGEGFALQWLEHDRALLTWFTYDTLGNQLWMIGVGQLDSTGRLVVPMLHSTHGGRFGSAFEASPVELVEWGSLVADFGCQSASIQYQSDIEAFGTGERRGVRLTTLAELDCPLFMPARAAVEDARWDSRFTVAGLAGKKRVSLDTMPLSPPGVHDLATLTDGTVLAAGTYSWSGQTSVSPLVQGTAGGGSWQSYPPIEGLETNAIMAIASDPSRPLAIVAAQPRRIVLIDNDTRQEIGRFSGQIRRLAWFDGQLWAAGPFELESDGPENLAVWDGAHWHAAPGGPPEGVVYALQASDQGLYVGGQFDQIGGIEARSAARWNGASWEALDMPVDEYARVFAFADTSKGLFAAGSGIGVRRWDGSDWQRLGGGLATWVGSGTVSDIHFFKGQLYAVGCFDFLSGPPDVAGSVPSNGIARWDGQAWQSLDDGSAPVGSVYSRASFLIGCRDDLGFVWSMEKQRLASDADHLYIAGSFPGIAGQASQFLIAYDGQAFKPVGHAGFGLSGRANRLALGPEGALYVFGPTHFGSEAAAGRVARFDPGSGWIPVSEPVPPHLDCSVFQRGLAVAGDGRVFLGCSDFSADPLKRDPSLWRARVLQLDGGSWVDIENARDFAPLSAIVSDPSGDIWIAGGNTSGYGSGHGYIARLQGDRFDVFEDGFNSLVSSLTFAPSDSDEQGLRFLASGPFTRVGQQASEFIVRWSDAQWQALDGIGKPPIAMEYGRERILVSVSGGSDSSDHLALGQWDGSSWIEVATPDNGFPQFDDDKSSFYQIREAGKRLFLTGSMPGYPGDSGNIFLYQDNQVELLAGGLSGGTGMMILSHDAITFGAGIEADPGGQPVSTMGIARLVWE